MIGIIGSLCNDRESASGQAVRTTILYNKLCDRYGKNNVYCVNTHGFRKNPVNVLIRTITCICKCTHIVIMAHENGRRIFFPIMYIAEKVFHRNVYHNVIGGSFAEYLEENQQLIKYAKSFKVHWVQMESQIKKLESLGLINTELLPNTKEIEITNPEEVKNYEDSVFHFCMCSRISVAKGTEAAIEAIEKVNNRAGKTVATLDIYGKTDADYEEKFREILSSVSDAIQYCGFIPNDKTVEKLRGYFMLLFPSTYAGEGFPGTVWDAFAAGVPIIATNWRYNAEVIKDQVTGLIYDYQHPDMLEKMIQYAMENKDVIDCMRINCIKDICQYTPDKVFPIIFKYFD